MAAGVTDALGRLEGQRSAKTESLRLVFQSPFGDGRRRGSSVDVAVDRQIKWASEQLKMDPQRCFQAGVGSKIRAAPPE